MAGWRCGSTVKRRCGLRWFKSTRGQASMNAGGPSALATGAGGGLWRRGHDDGAHGGTPASLHALRWLTGLCQRARGETMGCWGDGGAITVVREWPGTSCALLWRRRSGGRSAAAAVRKRRRRERNGSAGWLGRALATLRRARARRGLRGQGAGDARPSPGTRGAQTLFRSATEERAFQFVSRSMAA